MLRSSKSRSGHSGLVTIMDCNIYDDERGKYHDKYDFLGANSLLETDFSEVVTGLMPFSLNEIVIIDISNVTNNDLTDHFDDFNKIVRARYKLYVDSYPNYNHVGREYILGNEKVHIYKNEVELFVYIKLQIEKLKEQQTLDGRKKKEDFSSVVSEIAERLDLIAESLDGLRINSISIYTEELRSIASEVKDAKSSSGQSRELVRQIIHKALITIGNIVEVVGDRKVVNITLCGVISVLVNLGGWGAVLCYTVTLGAWHGKDAYIAAVQSLPMGNGRNAVSGRISKSPRKGTSRSRKTNDQSELPDLD